MFLFLNNFMSKIMQGQFLINSFSVSIHTSLIVITFEVLFSKTPYKFSLKAAFLKQVGNTQLCLVKENGMLILRELEMTDSSYSSFQIKFTHRTMILKMQVHQIIKSGKQVSGQTLCIQRNKKYI